MWEGLECPDRLGTEAAPTFSVCDWSRFITALQDCVVQIGWMSVARIERDDHALTLEIDFYILHPGNFHQNRSQLAHTLVAIFAFTRDLDRFHDFVIAPFREKWIGRIGITRSCRVHRVLVVS